LAHPSLLLNLDSSMCYPRHFCHPNTFLSVPCYDGHITTGHIHAGAVLYNKQILSSRTVTGHTQISEVFSFLFHLTLHFFFSFAYLISFFFVAIYLCIFNSNSYIILCLYHSNIFFSFFSSLSIIFSNLDTICYTLILE